MAEEAAAAGMTAAAVDLTAEVTAEVIGMAAIAKETTEAMVLVVETVGVTAGVTAGPKEFLTVVKCEAALTKAVVKDGMTVGVAVLTVTEEMTAGAAADLTATDVAAGMTAGVTAEATIALAVVIDMNGGLKTDDLPIAMTAAHQRKGQDCN